MWCLLDIVLNMNKHIQYKSADAHVWDDCVSFSKYTHIIYVWGHWWTHLSAIMFLCFFLYADPIFNITTGIYRDARLVKNPKKMVEWFCKRLAGIISHTGVILLYVIKQASDKNIPSQLWLVRNGGPICRCCLWLCYLLLYFADSKRCGRNIPIQMIHWFFVI